MRSSAYGQAVSAPSKNCIAGVVAPDLAPIASAIWTGITLTSEPVSMSSGTLSTLAPLGPMTVPWTTGAGGVN